MDGRINLSDKYLAEFIYLFKDVDATVCLHILKCGSDLHRHRINFFMYINN